MSETIGIQIGHSSASAKITAQTILEILQAPNVDNKTKREALRTLTMIQSGKIENVTVRDSSVMGPTHHHHTPAQEPSEEWDERDDDVTPTTGGNNDTA